MQPHDFAPAQLHDAAHDVPTGAHGVMGQELEEEQGQSLRPCVTQTGRMTGNY